MQYARQGVDVAAHCNEALLSAGALLDFRAHVEGLLARGDRAGALVLWDPWWFSFTSHTSLMRSLLLTGYPPWRNALAPFPRAHDVSKVGGVSVSRGSGFAVVFWRSLARHRPKCGVDTMLTWRGWISCSWRRLRPGGRGRTSCPSMWSGCFTGWMPPLRVDSAAEGSSRLGASGSWGGPAGGNQHMNRSWDSPLVGQWGPGERSGTGWAASPVASNFSHRCASFAIFLRLPLATAVQYARTAAAILGLAAASAMAQEHGIYARMAMEGGTSWTPESALDKALAASLPGQSPESRRSSKVVPDAARVIEGDHRGSVRPSSSVAASALARHRGVRLTPREPRLGLVLQQAGALRPSGHVSTLLRAEWQAACRRLGQQLTKRAEKVTVQNALRTWAELEGFLQRCSSRRPPAPARSLASLRWILNQAKVNMDLQMIQLPRRVASRPHKRGQAAVMEPSMVNHLERRIVQMFEAGEERWSALLGGWLVMAGVLRYKHVTMAEPSQDHAECPARPLSQG